MWLKGQEAQGRRVEEDALMPLTKKGKKIKRALEQEYGKERGERVFYGAENKGTIKGVAKHKRKRG